MPFQCIICLQPLLASGDFPAAIPCGHVYHKNCLRPWVNENHNCPLCKKSCSFRQIISPLYLSSEDEHDSGITAAETSEHTQTLQLRVLSLMREKETATQNFNTAKQALQDEREKSQVMASDLRGATKAVRHMKQIRRVAELDDLMNSPTAKAFFQNLESFSKEDLLIQNRAMQSRLKKAHTERDDAVRKSSILERENLHLQKKIERLKEKLQTTETGHPAQSKPKRTNNIIILDESDEDNSEDDNITLDDDDSDSPVLLTEESSTSNNASDNHSSYNRNNSNRQSLKRHYSLLSDNDDDYSVEEHRIPNLGHLHFSRWN